MPSPPKVPLMNVDQQEQNKENDNDENNSILKSANPSLNDASVNNLFLNSTSQENGSNLSEENRSISTRNLIQKSDDPLVNLSRRSSKSSNLNSNKPINSSRSNLQAEHHNLINDILVITPNQKNQTATSNIYETCSLDSSSNASIYSLHQNDQNENQNQVNTDTSAITNTIVKDPILIRGAGNVTIFGVSNKFNDQFPTQLNAKLAPEEFRDTIKQINSILSKELENSFKWLVFGSIFCCCTLGCSFLPVIYMNKKAKLSINKLLEIENQRLYLKLGLKWKLSKIKCNSNSLLEYVILIEFLPTILLYQPD